MKLKRDTLNEKRIVGLIFWNFESIHRSFNEQKIGDFRRKKERKNEKISTILIGRYGRGVKKILSVKLRINKF